LGSGDLEELDVDLYTEDETPDGARISIAALSLRFFLDAAAADVGVDVDVDVDVEAEALCPVGYGVCVVVSA